MNAAVLNIVVQLCIVKYMNINMRKECCTRLERKPSIPTCTMRCMRIYSSTRDFALSYRRDLVLRKRHTHY